MRALASRTLFIFCLLASVAVVLFPILWMAFASFHPTREILAFWPVWMPRHLIFSGYRKLVSDTDEARYFLNSCVIALGTAILSIMLGTLCAYGFSRMRIPGARTIVLGILALQMLPTVSIVLPLFRFAIAIGIYNTYLALIIVNTAFALPIAIWLLKGFFDGIPIALEDAAMIDGCTRSRALLYVVLPLVVPGLVATAVFAFLSAWNEFLFALVMTSGPSVAPLTIRMSQFFNEFGADWNGIMALNVMACAPLVVVFVFVQRWVVEGLTAGAVK